MLLYNLTPLALAIPKDECFRKLRLVTLNVVIPTYLVLSDKSRLIIFWPLALAIATWSGLFHRENTF